MTTEGKRTAGGLAACVINHDGEAFLEETLAALFREGSAFDEVLLIDDASKDRSVAIVSEKYPSVRVVALVENRGPAHARQAGFLEARAERILFLDNDVSIRPGSVARLVEALDENPLAVLATPRVLFASRPDTIQYDGARSHFCAQKDFYCLRMLNLCQKLQLLSEFLYSCILL
ncbi:MAG: glycosyltransferase family 2 protein [Candidatus Eisenbacteria bacterium]